VDSASAEVFVFRKKISRIFSVSFFFWEMCENSMESRSSFGLWFFHPHVCIIILLQPDAEAKSLMNIKTGAGRGRDFVVIIVATVSFQIVVEESAPKRFCIPIPLSSSSWLIPKSLDNRKTFVTLSVWSKGVSALL